ncbi:hypothetical protein [Metabacillus litoralis]|uniref:hypothetical protein n=1 Tax=Metabacillus litoralis TaxID=152268 RepID=UPI0020404BD1|nr:hypothetical protein [Metabacillus litoralis]MCM3651659.1 hypothetical protein [Metabacillus litoralis]
MGCALHTLEERDFFRNTIKKNCRLTLQSIKENIRDIAGVRITCSFISNIYKLSEMLKTQKDRNFAKLIETKKGVKQWIFHLFTPFSYL